MNIGSETEQIEYKKSTSEINEGIISIAAILNKHQSGELYFGVKNDGTILGQEIGDSTLRTVSQSIRNHIRPMIYPEIKVLDYDGSQVIYVKFSGTRCPYTAFNIARIRVSDEDVVMDQETYEDMLRKRDNISGYSWESRISKYRVDDVNEEVLQAYLRKAHEANRITFEHTDKRSVLKTLGLLEGDYLLNAGAALFCECGMNELQMAKFATNERLTFTDIRRFTGSIMTLKEKAEQYVIDAMDWKAEITGLSRKEIPEVPVAAVREAIINSFGHKLFESGQANEVAVYRDRIEIYSPGEFPKNHSPESFVKENKAPIRRNALITRTLYYSQDMEAFATGLKRIQYLCDEAGCKVEFKTVQGGFVVCFYRGMKAAFRGEPYMVHDGAHDEIHDRAHDEMYIEKYDDTLNVEENILKFCTIARSRAEIVEFCGFKSRSQFMTRYLTPLIESKKLRMTIPDKPKSKKQKYLTV